ncbi:ABC transporter permease [Paraoerskovia marina]|uniref:ABC transporter permease n=1 Tax=Paraoerskovia marina TaxID=545619 RepID=UPI000492E295|nr:ABC transporter permease [Paraoerskovia marina]
MSAATTSPRAVDHASLRLTFGHVVRHEWIKLTSIRSIWWFLVATVGSMVVFGVVASSVVAGAEEIPETLPPGAPNLSDPLSVVLGGSGLALLIIGVLGAMIGAREYGSGMVRTTLTVVPRRLWTLGAKVLCFVAVLTPTVLLSCAMAFTAGMPVLDAAGKETVAITDDGVLGAVLGTAGYLVGVGVLGLCLGVAFRSVAASIGTLVGVVIVLPQLASMIIPEEWDGVLAYLPSNAASSFTAVVPPDGMLSAAGGVAVFVAWVVAALVWAAVGLVRRDA